MVDIGTSRGAGIPAPEVGRFTGRMGGRVVVTRELFAWIIYHAGEVMRDLARERSLQSPTGIKKKDIVSRLQEHLLQGAYQGERIELSESTLDKILSWRYPELLRRGIPAGEDELIDNRELMKDQEKIAREGTGLLAEERLRLRQIWAIIENDPKVLLRFPKEDALDVVRQEQQKIKILGLFPGVRWPVFYNVLDMKDDVYKALKQKPSRAVRPRRDEPKRRGRGVTLQDTDFDPGTF